MPGLSVARISRLAVSIVLIALGVTQTAPVEVNAAGESWFNSSWQLRKSITIDAAKVISGTHTDFPVLVNLSSDASLAANAQADADDILFTSSGGATKLSHEIEKYTSATGELVAWVKVPSLSSDSNTVLYMYYDNASATNQQDAANVWDANYKAVWHLPNGTTLTASDSTSNARNGTITGVVAATGKIDGAGDFESSDTSDNIDAGTWSVSASAFSFFAWINIETFVDGGRVANKANGDQTESHVWMLSTTDTVNIRFRLKTGTNDTAGTTTLIGTGGGVTTGVWHYVGATYDGATMRLYLNGVVDPTTAAKTGALRENAWVNFIGNGRDTSNTGFTNQFDGLIDEPRVSSVARSAGWITTEFNNQGTPTTFYAVGAVENVPVAPPPPPTPIPVTLTVDSTSPTNSATGVAANTTVSATFSLLMNGSTLNTTTFKLSGGGGDVSGVVTTNGATATFTPSTNLAHNTTYTATITRGASAANFAGTTLDNDFTWSFTTTGDAVPPTVSSTIPANGAAGVAINSAITATFSEAMQSSTINRIHLR